MTTYEVCGTLSLDSSTPSLEGFYATEIVNNVTPDTYPYIAVSPVWASGSSGTLPTVTAWARRGRYTQLAPGSENTRFAYHELELADWGGNVRVTLEFEVGDDYVIELPNTSGPVRFKMPDDVVLSITCENLGYNVAA